MADDGESAGTGWVPDAPQRHPAAVQVELPVDQVRFSQTTIGGPTHLHGHEISVPALVDTFRERGYVSEPIQVVLMPDGKLTSMDNRRLWAAREAGLSSIPAIVHDHASPFDSPRQVEFLRRSAPLVDHHAEFGPAGATLAKKGAVPETMGQAVTFRCARQGRRNGQDFPLIGSPESPRYTGEKKSATARAPIVGRGDQPKLSPDRPVIPRLPRTSHQYRTTQTGRQAGRPGVER